MILQSYRCSLKISSGEGPTVASVVMQYLFCVFCCRDAYSGFAQGMSITVRCCLIISCRYQTCGWWRYSWTRKAHGVHWHGVTFSRRFCSFGLSSIFYADQTVSCPRMIVGSSHVSSYFQFSLLRRIKLTVMQSFTVSVGQ